MMMAVAFAAVLVAAAVLDVTARRRPESRLPTLGRCLAVVLRHPAGRVAVVLAWCWMGWHFLAR
ncbi:DUF6186 family protein [Nonomuraea sp. NPDC050328]